MKIHNLNLWWKATLVSLGGLSLAALAQVNKGTDFQKRLNVDNSPPVRTGVLGGYAGVVEKIAPAVVSIHTSQKLDRNYGNNYQDFFSDLFGRGGQLPTPRGQSGMGSGVIVSSDGYIVTNHHVVSAVRGARQEIKVSLADEREFEAKLVGSDKDTDLAVLKIEGDNLPSATIGDSSQLKPGDIVLALGNPFGLSETVTSGIVSALGRSNLRIGGMGAYENFIQTSAAINPGNSGGALVDNQGRLVGINTAIYSRTGGSVGIGFAIPSNLMVNVVDQLATDGEVKRGYLGIVMGPVNPGVAKALGVPAKGAIVTEVVPGSPAAKAGFRERDVIVAVNRASVSDPSALRVRVGGTRPGKTAKFDVIRDGRDIEVDVTLGTLNPDEIQPAQFRSQSSPTQPKFSGNVSGMSFTDLDRETRRQNSLGANVQGVLVASVQPGSAADQAGVRPGMVITEIAKQPVSSADQASKVLAKAGPGFVLLRVTSSEGSQFVGLELE